MSTLILTAFQTKWKLKCSCDITKITLNKAKQNERDF